ncbi:MAG: hypothetical protein A3E87_02230 [Gammaproteobacteria bacterium RIFCSPHIGHO2_12_FULL_35_23]|nr:MAG: hypothetical protein A3E87_02230 [Gammaproteobacteria bacterium RIFCSPHIGHO2_12_FULL_35_23]
MSQVVHWLFFSDWICKFLITGKHPTDLVIDSTGLKIFGEGEWKMRTHGKQKRRTWRKYHVSVNPATHEATAIELTQANVHDCMVFINVSRPHHFKQLTNFYC